MPKTKKNSSTMNKYHVTFINTYKLESIGCDSYEYSEMNDYIYAENVVEAYKIANDMLIKINSMNEMQKYVIKDIDVYD